MRNEFWVPTLHLNCLNDYVCERSTLTDQKLSPRGGTFSIIQVRVSSPAGALAERDMIPKLAYYACPLNTCNILFSLIFSISIKRRIRDGQISPWYREAFCHQDDHPTNNFMKEVKPCH